MARGFYECIVYPIVACDESNTLLLETIQAHPRRTIYTRHLSSAQGLVCSCRQPRICQALAADRFNHRVQPLKTMPFDIAFVQPEGELIDVPGKVLHAHAVVDAVVAAFQDGPDAFNGELYL